MKLLAIISLYLCLKISSSYSFRNIPINTKLKLTSTRSPISNHQLPLKNTHLYSARCEQFAEFIETKPRWGGRIIGPIVRYFNTIMIGVIFTIILRIRNKFSTIRSHILFGHIWNRPKTQGLLTVSNHKSFYDDPGLWAALLPWWRFDMNPKLRWSLCTEDVFFSVSLHINKYYPSIYIAPIYHS